MNFTTRALALNALIAAVYVAITLPATIISFGEFQFRIAEALNLLIFYNPIFAIGVVIGTFLANFLGSPYGILDAVLGTGASVIVVTLIIITKRITNNLFLASLWATIVNALLIPLVIIYGAGAPFSWAAYISIGLSVALGQFVVVSIFGYSLFLALNMKYKNFRGLLENI